MDSFFECLPDDMPAADLLAWRNVRLQDAVPKWFASFISTPFPASLHIDGKSILKECILFEGKASTGSKAEHTR
jgi:hypothetical protein